MSDSRPSAPFRPRGPAVWPGTATRLPIAARRVHERPPEDEDLLAGATPLPPLPDGTLAVVARALAEAGHVVFVRDGADGRRLLYAERSRATARGDRPPPEPVLHDRGRYEDEGCQRLALGSVRVSDAAWWSASLAVPASEEGTVLLTLRRHGASAPSYVGDPSVDLTLPAGEVQRVATLLTGVVAQARSAGMLGAAPADDAERR